MVQELECAKSNGTLNGKNHILAVNTLKQNIFGDSEEIDLFDLIEELLRKYRNGSSFKPRMSPR